MQLSLEPADAINHVPTMPSNREFNENFVIRGHFIQKILFLQLKCGNVGNEQVFEISRRLHELECI